MSSKLSLPCFANFFMNVMLYIFISGHRDLDFSPTDKKSLAFTEHTKSVSLTKICILPRKRKIFVTRHQECLYQERHYMMTASNGNIFRVTGLLCGEFTGPGEFPTQRPVTRSFDVFFDMRMNKRLSKQPWGWWFETPSWSLWRQYLRIPAKCIPHLCFSISLYFIEYICLNPGHDVYEGSNICWIVLRYCYLDFVSSPAVCGELGRFQLLWYHL